MVSPYFLIMYEPKIPDNLIGMAVISKHRRLGLIQLIGQSTHKPYVLWEGNTIPIVTEWDNIEPFWESLDLLPNTAEVPTPNA